MELATPLSNLRTQLVVVVADHGSSIDREAVWPEAAEEFLRRMYKLGIQVTIIGARPPHKFGSKKSIRFMDRHEVVGMKVLAASRSHPLEFRILNTRTKAWTRLRAQCCVTLGSNGVWPVNYEGWTLPGTLTIHALARWIVERKWMPGREFVFIGSTNQALRWATMLLSRGAKSCYIVESASDLRCWRAYRDRFVSKGGRVLLNHSLKRVEQASTGGLQLFIDNQKGTLIVEADTVVLLPSNENALNEPSQWKNGLFYVQRRKLPHEQQVDEEAWFEKVDWREVYWRVARFFDVVDHAEADGALKNLKNERRKMLEYRRIGVGAGSSAALGTRRDLGYSGKILDRNTVAMVQSSGSVPRTFAKNKPVASLECFENLPCRACVDACPDGAISMSTLLEQPSLNEDKCTGCGLCVAVCPAGAAVMVKELPQQQKARYFLPDDTTELWKSGRPLQLLNRRGDVLGVGRAMASTAYQGGQYRVIEIESTNVNLWEARGFRIPKTDFSSDDHASGLASPSLLKRGWVTINGVRRLCPVDVPVTVALWQLGQKRFEDARFCDDGGCRMCEVMIDGKPSLACRTTVVEGQQITFERNVPVAGVQRSLCVCKNVTVEQYKELRGEAISAELTSELTGLGAGACHGRWCLASCEFSGPQEKARPSFHGYAGSPWRDIWAEDVTDFDEEETF